MRTKLPKLLAKTMSIRRSNYNRTDNVNDDSSGTRMKKKKKKKISAAISSEAKNVCSILRNALTSKKSSSSSSEGDDRVCSVNAHECKECSVEREEIKRNGSCSLIIEEREQQNVNNKISDLHRAKEKPPTKVSLPFSGFLSKKLNKATRANLTRVSSMGFKSLRKETIKNRQDETEATDERREELCKKRILMGGKCRPLHASGALHYDNNGILLPEEILSCDDEDYYLV